MKPFHPTALLAVTRNGRRYVLSAHSVRHDETIRALHRVATARLRQIAIDHREGGSEKQETPGTGIPEVSTAPDLCTQMQEGRYGQFGTR